MNDNIYTLTKTKDGTVRGILVYRARRREWEAEYVSEFCQKTFPGVPTIYHVRLGTLPETATGEILEVGERAMLKVRMRWADAVTIQPTKITVIEAKLRAAEYAKGFGELQLYVNLIKVTPEFGGFRTRRVQGLLVTPIHDPTIQVILEQADMQYMVYKPTFWPEYTKILAYGQTRPIRPEEAKILGG